MFQKALRSGLPALLGSALTLLVLWISGARQVSDVTTLGGQQLGDCEVEVRPKSEPKLLVLWEESTTQMESTLVFDSYPMRAGKVAMGDHEAGSEVSTKALGNDRATFKWDRAKKSLTLTLTNGTDTKTITNVPYTGQYDALARATPPLVEEVDRQSANPKLKRLRITTEFRGLTVAWTIWDL